MGIISNSKNRKTHIDWENNKNTHINWENNKNNNTTIMVENNKNKITTIMVENNKNKIHLLLLHTDMGNHNIIIRDNRIRIFSKEDCIRFNYTNNHISFNSKQY